MASLRISELMVRNRAMLRDEDGDFSDWVELENYGDTALSLEGFRLTDKAGGKGLERPHLDGLVVHEGTGAAAPGDRAADDQVAAVRVQVVLLSNGPERLVLLHVEFRLDHAGIPAGTDRPGVSPGAEDEGKGAQQDGLAGAGLPGYNDETLRKTDLQRVYQDVIRDEEFREHRAYLPALR